MTNTETDWLQLNRENWDDRVRVHVVSNFYDLPGFRAGGSTLRSFAHGKGLEHDYFQIQAETYDFPHTCTDGPPLTPDEAGDRQD
ncbi:hypothetical protein ACWDSL_36970 [Streptomyces sp. NPDC000941]